MKLPTIQQLLCRPLLTAALTLGAATAHGTPASDPASSSPKPPIRAVRKIQLGLNAGWNDYGGAGIRIGYHLHPHFALEAGGGMGIGGLRGGLRARYSMLKGNVTPYLAAGAFYGVGFGSTDVTINGAASKVQMRSAPYANAVLGFDWVHDVGIAFGMEAGYSRSLTPSFTILSGVDTPGQRSGIEIFTSNGVIIGATAGYAF